MKQLNGAATAKVGAPIDRCFTLLADVEQYPSWHSELIRAVTVLERDERGLPTRASTTLHVAHGPLVRDFDFLLDVRFEQPELVELSRVPDDPADEEQLVMRWRLGGSGETGIELELHARLAVPRFVPLGSIGDALGGSFLRAAVRRLEEDYSAGR
ncbi:MAG TPA: SRPBCC family protein [Solirubrobacteraceae bacterium]|jgi:ribosome-associated toxin RatA of RatAB toxin-antitoxin module|nr:SRPBCC family protein [Solirubrobacteraceae bacterium]